MGYLTYMSKPVRITNVQSKHSILLTGLVALTIFLLGCDSSNFTQGPTISTGRELDLAIEGNGFFLISDDSGKTVRTLYTRTGNFEANADGNLRRTTDCNGRMLAPSITIPKDAKQVIIDRKGDVGVVQPGVEPVCMVGPMRLATFPHPNALRPVGNGLFAETPESGPPILGEPGDKGFGELRVGVLEGSYADPREEKIWTQICCWIKTVY